MLVIIHLLHCLSRKFKMDNNYTEMFRRAKISIQELQNEEKILLFLNVINIDYSRGFAKLMI